MEHRHKHCSFFQQRIIIRATKKV